MDSLPASCSGFASSGFFSIAGLADVLSAIIPSWCFARLKEWCALPSLAYGIFVLLCRKDRRCCLRFHCRECCARLAFRLLDIVPRVVVVHDLLAQFQPRR